MSHKLQDLVLHAATHHHAKFDSDLIKGVNIWMVLTHPNHDWEVQGDTNERFNSHINDNSRRNGECQCA